ncbi:MAG: hypothetical protein M3137_02690, partial [Actinomycetota bacterium]|nr:hypothetical protein [Actinomycetota bacterium]
TFNLFGPNDATCTGPAVFTSTVTVDGSGSYNSGSFTAVAQPGIYRFVASYSGDANNAAVGPTACADPAESVVVSPTTTSTSTTLPSTTTSTSTTLPSTTTSTSVPPSATCDAVKPAPTVGPPTAQANPSAVQAGDDTSVTGAGFSPGDSLGLTLCSSPVNLGTVTADPAGNIVTTVRIPAGTTVGTHAILVTNADRSRIAIASLTVIAPSSSAPGTGTGTGTGGTSSNGGGPLARTGADVAWMAGFAVLALLLGLFLVRAARLRLYSLPGTADNSGNQTSATPPRFKRSGPSGQPGTVLDASQGRVGPEGFHFRGLKRRP